MERDLEVLEVSAKLTAAKMANSMLGILGMGLKIKQPVLQCPCLASRGIPCSVVLIVLQ